MLPEDKVLRTESQDGGKRVILHVGRSLGTGTVPCTLLLDAQGALVGLDLDPDRQRTVLMIGEHEDVRSTEPAEAMIDGAKVILISGRAVRLR